MARAFNLAKRIRPSVVTSAAQYFVHTLDWLLSQKRISSLDAIFVMGCQHSGTSIVHRLLGYHTSVFQIPKETYWFRGSSLKAKSKREILGALNIMSLFQADILLEKTPSSFKNIKLVKKVFPRSKIIFMLRDPRDVCASLKSRGATLSKACSEWSAAARIILDNQVNSDILIVRLEEFLLDPDCKLREMQDFCGLELEDLTALHGLQPKNFYSKNIEKPSSVEDGPNHNMHRNWQINQPLFSSSSRWQADLSQEEVDLIANSVSVLARELGYTF